MRKLHYMLILTMAAVISGCTEQKEMDFEPINNSGYTILEANIESLLFDSQERMWPEDAYIGVYGSEMGENERYSIKEAGVGLKSATFYGPLVKGNVAAYYPYSPSYIGNADGMPVTLESEQTYNPEADAVAHFQAYTPRAYGYMQDGKINFVYPNGILYVSVETYETLVVKSITISSASSALAGLGIFGKDGVLSMTETSQKAVVLDCGEGVLSRNGDDFTDFYMTLVPGTYEDLEISIELDGEAPFGRMLPPIEVKRVSTADFAIASVNITAAGGPDDFIDTPVEFE